MSYFAANAYDLFKRGYDTLEIARLLQRKEARVLYEISVIRSAKLGKPLPYSPFTATALQPADAPVRSLIPYAGSPALTPHQERPE